MLIGDKAQPPGYASSAQAFTEDGATMQANSVPDIVSQKIKANTGHASVWVARQTNERIAQGVAALK